MAQQAHAPAPISEEHFPGEADGSLTEERGAEQYIDAREDPEAAIAALQAAEADMRTDAHEVVEPEDPADPYVELAGGLRWEGDLLIEARVAELNGADEEELAKEHVTTNWARYLQTLLARAVEQIGGVKPNKKMLDALYIGDRDLLAMHIRRVTYGDEIEMKVRCPNCENEFDILYSISKDVPVRKFEDNDTGLHEVTLRNGNVATVRMPNGADQQAVLAEGRKKNLPEQNTIMLDRVIIAYNGGPPPESRELAGGDRAKILNWIAENMPGPRLADVTMDCDNCGRDFPVVLTLIDMFRLI